MAKTNTAPRAKYQAVRFVLVDWKGPVGVFTAVEDLADALHKLARLPNSDVALDYRVLRFRDGLVDRKPVEILVRSIMNRYPEKPSGFRSRFRH